MKNNSEHKRYEVREWREDSIKSWYAYIYIAGDIQNIKTKCRELCFPKGLCVTVESVYYVYAGGVEDGCRIGLIQYPPFPEDEKALLTKAIMVGKSLAEINYQWSFTITTPKKNYFYSRRNK